MSRAPNPKSLRTVGIAWYLPEDYEEIRRIMLDGDVLPLDYDTWLKNAQGVVLLEEAKGSRIVKAVVRPKPFIAWCRATNQRADVDARTRHVNLAIEGDRYDY